VTHAELVKLAERWLSGTRKCAIVATERTCWQRSESPDAIGWTPRGESVLVECKTSHADFLADLRKPHRAERVGMGLERWYLAQDGVLKFDTIPAGWGLLVFRSGRVYRAMPAQLRTEQAGAIAIEEQPFLVALVRKARGNANGIVATDVDLEAA
jgi:hypothetical protein